MNEPMSLMTISLILSIGVISIWAFSNPGLIDQGKHYPYVEHRQRSYHRWFTCGFLHANWLHLFLNVFVLWQFGTVVERMYQLKFGQFYGSLAFLIVYLLILLGSNYPTYIKHKNNPSYASIGASGAISGVLFIYILYFPTRLLFLFGLVPLPGIVFGLLYLYYSWWASKNTSDIIDHDAHYYGAVLGVVFGLLVKYVLPV